MHLVSKMRANDLCMQRHGVQNSPPSAGHNPVEDSWRAGH